MTPEVNKFAAQVAKGHVARLAERGAKIGPIQTEQDLFARGYIGEDGQATDEGSQFLTLQDAGIFDEKGNFTMKGQASIMDEYQLTSGPETLPYYIAAQEAGLMDKPEVSLGDAVGAVGDVVWDFGKAAARKLGRLGWAPNPETWTDEQKAEAELDSEAMLMTGLRQSASTALGIMETAASGLTVGGDQIGGVFDKEEDKLNYYYAKQQFDKARLDVQDLEYAQIVGAAVGSHEVVEELRASKEAAVNELGPERAAEIIKGGEALGTFINPETILTAGTGFFVGKAAGGPSIMMRLGDKVADAQIAQSNAIKLAAKATAAEKAAAQAKQLAEKSFRRGDDLAGIGDDAAASSVRGVGINASQRGTRLEQSAATLKTAAAEAAERAQIAVKKAGGAERILAAAETAKQLRAMPAATTAKILDNLGDTLIRTDEALSDAMARAGFKPGFLGGVQAVAGGLGVAGGFGVFLPGALAIPASIPAMIAAGPVLKKVADFARIVGKEQMAARGSLPFWRRVATNTSASPLTKQVAKGLDSMTLGGKVFAPARAAGTVAKGIAAAAPMDIGFEILGEGGEVSPGAIKQGLAESILFAGTGSLAGSIVGGSVKAKQRQQMGDVINFKSGITGREKQIFSGMSKGAQRTLATYAAVNPSVKFELSDSGVSNYDPRTSTVKINTKSGNWLRPLVAHEMLHHVVIKGQMEGGIQAMLVGDGYTGGMFRDKDGNLSPEFKSAMDQYNARLTKDGKTPAVTPEQFAQEYFIESMVDDMLELTESGKLSAMAARSPLERVVRDMGREIIARTPFIRDLSLKLGGAFDKGGRPVQGNGLLADGVRELPGAKKMLRDMLRRQAGEEIKEIGKTRKRKVDGVVVDEEVSGGIPVEMLRNNPSMAESFFSVFQKNPDGTLVQDASGNPIFIDRKTDNMRKVAGLAAIQQMEEDIRTGKQMPENGLKPQEDGSWQGEVLTDSGIAAIQRDAKLDPRQIENLRMFNAAAKAKDGQTFLGWNHGATVPTPGKRKQYGSLEATLREFAPAGVKITAKGNILISLLSVTQLMQNVETRAKSKRGMELYDGNQLAILADVQAVLDLHKINHPTDGYFRDKYGPRGETYKRFINTIFGLMTKEQQNINPMFLEDSVNYSSNVYKTYRLDRISQVTRLQGGMKLPFSFTHIKANYFPNGAPIQQP